MKTKRMKVFASALLFMLAFACEQDDLTDDEYDQMHSGDLKSVTTDTTMVVVPDIVVEDSILITHASVSQYREDYITYTYDRYGRLFNINYFRRNIGITTSAADIAPRYVYMQDRFVYNNAGRLAEILRYDRTNTPQLTNVRVRKNYKYNTAGQLAVIVTNWPNAAEDREKIEYLYYDKTGNMVKKAVKEPDRPPYYFTYTYDRSGRLVKIAGYHDESDVLQFICHLYYDNRNNIERKAFYYPAPLAASVNDVIRKWVVYYKYDNAINPFRDFNLPVSSLFEWMDVISPNNVTAIVFDNGSLERAVCYKYRYNNFGYPVLRLRSNELAFTDSVE
ncbi:MAG: hypothetical protein JXB19_04520 [Bacteroidales bacterium]|nr:hypothetical protein [Bacteroidales bacterium]